MDNSTYVVVAANHCWGAAESLKEALSNAYLTERTRLSHFDYVDSQEELNQMWADWKDYGEETWRLGSDYEDPIDCVIFWLDCELWESWKVSGMTGGVTAVPKDPEMSGDEASKKLAEIQIKATFHNGALKPRK